MQKMIYVIYAVSSRVLQWVEIISVQRILNFMQPSLSRNVFEITILKGIISKNIFYLFYFEEVYISSRHLYINQLVPVGLIF